MSSMSSSLCVLVVLLSCLLLGSVSAQDEYIGSLTAAQCVDLPFTLRANSTLYLKNNKGAWSMSYETVVCNHVNDNPLNSDTGGQIFCEYGMKTVAGQGARTFHVVTNRFRVCGISDITLYQGEQLNPRPVCFFQDDCANYCADQYIEYEDPPTNSRESVLELTKIQYGECTRCLNDNHCPQSQLCRNYTCSQCTVNADCLPRQHCSRGHCIRNAGSCENCDGRCVQEVCVPITCPAKKTSSGGSILLQLGSVLQSEDVKSACALASLNNKRAQKICSGIEAFDALFGFLYGKKKEPTYDVFIFCRNGIYLGTNTTESHIILSNGCPLTKSYSVSYNDANKYLAVNKYFTQILNDLATNIKVNRYQIVSVNDRAEIVTSKYHSQLYMGEGTSRTCIGNVVLHTGSNPAFSILHTNVPPSLLLGLVMMLVIFLHA